MASPKASGPVVGGMPSLRQAALARRQRDQANKVLSMSLLSVLVTVAAIAASTGILSVRRSNDETRAATEVKVPEDPTKAVVKRPLPEGMTDENVVKWVPIRQSSGRTELEAWTSVDHHWAEMPEMIDGVMATQETLERRESTSEWPIDTAGAEELIETN